MFGEVKLNNGFQFEQNRRFKFVHTTSLSVYINHKFVW